MGERLLKYYQYVDGQKGLSGKIQLAQATKIPSVNAAMAPDSEDNLKRFRDEVTKITGKPAPVF